MTERRSGAWAGWVAFAGMMLLINGVINGVEGLVALFNDERLVVTRERLVMVDVTTWGWVLVGAGLLLTAAGIGLLLGATWARFTAIVLVGLHAAAQVLWLGAYPVWALLMITLDVVVLFALTARWSGARPYDDGGWDARAERLPSQTASYGPKLT